MLRLISEAGLGGEIDSLLAIAFDVTGSILAVVSGFFRVKENLKRTYSCHAPDGGSKASAQTLDVLDVVQMWKSPFYMTRKLSKFVEPSLGITDLGIVA